MKPRKEMTGEECNAKIRELQTEMQTTTNPEDRNRIRSLISLYAKEAAFKNRNEY